MNKRILKKFEQLTFKQLILLVLKLCALTLAVGVSYRLASVVLVMQTANLISMLLCVAVIFFIAYSAYRISEG